MLLTRSKSRDTAFDFALLSGLSVNLLLLEQIARYSISFELLSGPSMIDTPKPLRWWQGSELRNSCDTPMIYRYRPESWGAFEAQISDDRTDRSLVAQLKCSRRLHHQFRDGKGKARNEHSGRYAEGSQWAIPAVIKLKSNHGIRSLGQFVQVQDSLERTIIQA